MVGLVCRPILDPKDIFLGKALFDEFLNRLKQTVIVHGGGKRK